MILIWLIAIPLLGGLLALYSGRRGGSEPAWVSLISLGLISGLIARIWMNYPGEIGLPAPGTWIAEIDREWVPQLGIRFHLALDGLSLTLLLLTAFLGVMAVLSSWTEIKKRAGFFYFNLLWVIAGIIGVFLAVDLFMFYFFWELMLVPMYLLIAIWGHENRHYAAVKFFLFTQLSGLMMLISILGLYFIHGKATGVYTFGYEALLETSLPPAVEFWLMLGFLAAFAVKLPVVPVHNWLPDAHTEAPTGGSVVLAGLLLKTGAYGLIRFVVPLFPHAAQVFAPAAMIIAVTGILYGAALAFSQTDLKRLVAYTSVSHMGFVFLGIFVWNSLALQGAVMQMVCHGIATGALFMLTGMLQERLGTREMSRMGGLWATVPRMGAAALFFAMASLGLPGLGNFVGEFLILIGTFRKNMAITSIAVAGVVTATVYSLWLVQRTFQGENTYRWEVPDLSLREGIAMGVMTVALLWLGLYPQPVLDRAGKSLDNIRLITGDRPASSTVTAEHREAGISSYPSPENRSAE
jgi:NADH-quinone oxidoreductase subunit M